MKQQVQAKTGGILFRLMFIPLTVCALSAGLYKGLAIQGEASRTALRASQEEALDRTVAETLRLRGAVLQNFVADYSLWGEMAEFARAPNPDWAKINLDGSLANFKLDGLWVFDASGKQSYALGGETEAPIVLLAGGDAHSIDSFFDSGPFFDRFAVDSQGTVLEFRGAKIQREDDVGRGSPALGYLLIKKAWSAEYLDQFAPVIGGELSIVGPGAACSSDTRGSATHASFSFGPPDAPVSSLCAVVQNPVSEQFEQYRSRTEISFGLFVVLLLVTLGVALHHLFLRPLLAIREGIRSETHPDLLKLARAKTEFGAVARRILDHAHATNERTRLQSEVARAGKLASVGVMGAMVAHELNNPLAVVLGYADLLASKPSGRLEDPENREALLALLSHAERMRRVVDMVRGFSWEQRKGPQRKPEDLNRIVTRSLQLIEPELRRASIRLEVHLDGDLPLVDCDHVQIETVIQNLIGNAREALERDGSPLRVIAIATHASTNEVQLEVADSGPGIGDISPEEVFAPFVSSKPVGTGSGLGLAISSAIVKDHDGDLSYARSKYGGAAFSMRLPRAEAA